MLIEHIGKLAVLKKDRDGSVFVIYNFNDETNELYIVELDNPNDGVNMWVQLYDLRILCPSEVIERVTEWH